MPLTTTALWPTLTGGRKAKASEVEAKFDWLEGAQLPMTGGNFTTGVYDIGSSAYQWRNGYFNNSVVVNNQTITSDMVGISVKAWVSMSVTATLTASGSFNVSSLLKLGIGVYQVSFTTPFVTNTYSAIAGGSTPNMNHTVSDLTVSSLYIKTYSPVGAPTDAPTAYLIATGQQ